MHDLKSIGATWAEATSADLTGLLDKEFTLAGPRISEGTLERLLGAKGSVVHTACTTEGEEHAELALVASLESALSLAAVQLGKEPGQLADAKFDAEIREAYKSVMDLCVGILGRVFDEEANLPGLTLGESSPLDLPIAHDAPLAHGVYRLARFELGIQGDKFGAIDMLLPAPLAASWFGASEAVPEVEQQGEDVALIDPSLSDRDEIDSLAESLGRKIIAIDASELGPDFADELEECCALIIGWDISGRPGLDLLEMMRGDARTAGLRIALSSEEPTPSMVSAALRWGAFTFLCKPYDPSEIRDRLLTPPPLP